MVVLDIAGPLQQRAKSKEQRVTAMANDKKKRIRQHRAKSNGKAGLKKDTETETPMGSKE